MLMSLEKCFIRCAGKKSRKVFYSADRTMMTVGFGYKAKGNMPSIQKVIGNVLKVILHPKTREKTLTKSGDGFIACGNFLKLT